MGQPSHLSLTPCDRTFSALFLPTPMGMGEQVQYAQTGHNPHHFMVIIIDNVTKPRSKGR